MTLSISLIALISYIFLLLLICIIVAKPYSDQNKVFFKVLLKNIVGFSIIYGWRYAILPLSGDLWLGVKEEIKYYYRSLIYGGKKNFSLASLLGNFSLIYFGPVAFLWNLYGYKYSIFLSYWRLYIYSYAQYKVFLNYSIYLTFKGEYNIKFDINNLYFNGFNYYIPSPIFFYSELHYPLITTVIWYKYLKSILIAVFGTLVILMNLVNFFYLNLIKQLAIWAVIGFLFFWLISGFNFFLKRYRYGKFTSSIARFWKRTNAIFWLVEGFLFGLFFYYYLNSSQEPLYFYDSSSLNQDYLNQLISTFNSYLFLVFIILYLYYILLKLPQFSVQQYLAHFLVITIGLVYVFYLESYQFYYILTMFYESIWQFDSESNLWVLESEAPRLRVKQQYLLLALIAKYWHFIFIFISWVFFIIKSIEQKRVYFASLGVNIQNFIILFLLNLLFIAQWFNWIFRRFASSVYYWFFTDINGQTILFILEEMWGLVQSLLNVPGEVFCVGSTYFNSFLFILGFSL